MRNGTKKGVLPALIGDVIADQKHYVVFRSILSGVLHDVRGKPGRSKGAIMEMIDERVNTFFVRSLHLDIVTLCLE